jgi:hypothetical protein
VSQLNASGGGGNVSNASAQQQQPVAVGDGVVGGRVAMSFGDVLSVAWKSAEGLRLEEQIMAALDATLTNEK